MKLFHILFLLFILVTNLLGDNFDTVLVSGIVTDQNQNKIGGLLIQFIGESTGDTATAITDSTGFYQVTLKKIITQIPQTQIPGDYLLYQNYPNPFNPGTVIAFQIPRQQYVLIEIYNILGQRIRTLGNNDFPAGLHNLTWDGTDETGMKVSSGVYYYKMITDNRVDLKKMVLLEGASANSFTNLVHQPPLFKTGEEITKYLIKAEKLGFHPIADEILEITSTQTEISKDLTIQRINFFPLAVGNSWTFRIEGAPEADTMTYYIERKVMSGGKEYYEFHNKKVRFLGDLNLLYRLNEQNDLIGKFGDNEEIIIQFSNYTLGMRIAHLGYSQEFNCDIDFITYLFGLNMNVDTFCVNFKNCVNYSIFIGGWIDSDHLVYFAPEIGPVKFYYGTLPILLVKANIKNN